MFSELAPEDVVGKLADLSRAEVEREWKRRKNKVEKAREGLGQQMKSHQERRSWRIHTEGILRNLRDMLAFFCVQMRCWGT